MIWDLQRSLNPLKKLKNGTLKFKNMKTTERLIDKVTTTNLDIALRMCNIQINKSIVDKIIDLV